jgi:hypothetical protein
VPRLADTPEPLCDVQTPLGFAVRTTAGYWELIQRKHAEISGRLNDVTRCLAAPDQVRQSKQDSAVYLFYRALAPYHLCVVVKRMNGAGFVITCYLTDAIKEGTRIWPTSG